MRRLFPLILFACCTFFIPALHGQANPCGHPITDNEATIILPADADLRVNGNPLPFGSEITLGYRFEGIFQCVWAATWNGENTFFTAFGEDADNDGFRIGQGYVFRFTLPGGCSFTPDEVAYVTNAPFTDEGFYRIDGLSAISSLSGNISLSLSTPQVVADTCGAGVGKLSVLPSGGSEPYSFAWSDGNDMRFRDDLTEGTYFLTVTDAGGCQEEATYAISNFVNIPPVDLGDEQTGFCSGTNLTLQSSFPSFTREWFRNGIPLAAATPALTVTTPGTYRLEIEDRYGCLNTDEIVVEEYDTPNADLGPDTARCTGTSSVLTVADCQNCTYNWSTGSSAPTITVPSGSYSLTLTSQQACTATDDIEITALPLPEVDLGRNDTFCMGETLILSGPTNAVYTYEWSNGIPTFALTVSASGVYALTVTDENQCVGSDEVNIEFLEQPNLFLETDRSVVCPGDSVLLSFLGADEFRWLEGVGALANPASPATYAFPSTLDTLFSAIGENDCFADTVSVVVDLFDIEVSAGPDTCIVSGTTIRLDATGGQEYIWMDNDFPVSITDVPDPEITPLETTTYRLLITDENRCVTEDSIFVEVVNSDPRGMIFTPNIITPNGDGLNDVLEFNTLDKFPLNKLTVHNRWGQVVFSSTDYQNDWGGTHKGQRLPTGAYFYVLEINSFAIRQALQISYE